MSLHRLTTACCATLLIGVASLATAAVTTSAETDIAPAGPEADTPYTPAFTAGGPSGSDILEGATPIVSDGNFFRTGSGGPRALTNGSAMTYYGDGLNEDVHGQYLSAAGGESLTYSLSGLYDISSVVIYGGWADGGRDQQAYDLQFSSDGGLNYTTVATVDVNGGVQGTDLTPVSTRVEISDDTLALLAEDITTVRVNFLAVENIWTGYAEIDVFGTLQSVPGDADHNSVVDANDFFAIRDHFNTTPSAPGDDGDLNYDNFVDGTDYLLWRDAAGESLASAFNLSVPEPSSAIVLLGALGGVVARSRGRRHA